MNRLSHFLQILLGFLLLGWYLWLRLLRPRLPKDWAQLMDIPLWYTAMMIFLSMIFLIWALNKHYFFWRPKLSPGPWSRKTAQLLIWMNKSPAIVFRQLWDPWTGPGKKKGAKKLLGLMHILRHRGEDVKIITVLTFFLRILPRTLVSLIFLLEVMVLGQLKTFYALLILLLIPWLHSGALHILKEVARDQLKEIEIHLWVQEGDEKYAYRLGPKIPMKEPIFDEYFEDWFTCHDFLAYTQDLDKCLSYENHILGVFHWYHYLLAWTYVFSEQMLWILR